MKWMMSKIQHDCRLVNQSKWNPKVNVFKKLTLLFFFFMTLLPYLDWLPCSNYWFFLTTHIVFISQVQTHVFFSSKLNVYCGGWDTAELAWNKSYKASQNVHVPRRTVFTPSVVMWGAMTWATRVWLIWSWISFLSTRVVSQHDLHLMLPMCMCTKRQSNGWSLQ